MGTLLFYEKYENNQWNYILVDGLQRGSCIRNYMTNPTEFFYNDNISDEICADILSIIGENTQENYAAVRTILTEFIKEQKSFKSIQFYEVAGQICQQFGKENEFSAVGEIIKIISKFFVALDSFFEKSMQRSEKRNIVNPRSEEYILLNCIYVKTFTAMDQLSVDKFDVEHIAPKEQMRKLIEACDGEGLPISCIANLCYLPESANRSKGAKNFYQDKKYLRN